MTESIAREITKKNTQQSTNDSWSACGKLSKSIGCTVVVDVMQFGVVAARERKQSKESKEKRSENRERSEQKQTTAKNRVHIHREFENYECDMRAAVALENEDF